MKTCPVCKAQCFDDMSICYGCMYHFPESAQTRNSSQKTKQDQEEAVEQFPEEPPAAVIDQVEAFTPDAPTDALQMEEGPQALQDNTSMQETGECVDGVKGSNVTSTPQAIVLPLEERGVEISIIVRQIGEAA